MIGAKIKASKSRTKVNDEKFNCAFNHIFLFLRRKRIIGMIVNNLIESNASTNLKSSNWIALLKSFINKRKYFTQRFIKSISNPIWKPIITNQKNPSRCHILGLNFNSLIL